MPNSKSRTIEIIDPNHVASTLRALMDSICDITVKFDDTPVHYPVSLTSIDRDKHFLMLDVANLSDVMERLTANASFTLHAKEASGTLSFDMLAAKEVERRGESIEFRCCMPTRLVVTRKRGVFRAQLTESMCTSTRLSLFVVDNAAPVKGKLKNLSLGGCLVEVSKQDAGTLHIGQNIRRVQALFPNGDNFHEAGKISHMHDAEQGETALIGIKFVPASKEFERKLWYFVREIEREAARQNAESATLLWPSKLFDYDGEYVFS
ncbi:flagellar brake protein [Phytohalomonas tamaricis]|uniref:flagellar brake protein n=1 Tax=Phytohalomonas tamaricis TaxID=2081032 RepID=UPI00131A080D|nr:flagellar brake protein [Phytohalomonas tamaricis]